MTKGARMSAVEGPRDRLAHWHALRIIDDHRGPRERLQSDPVQTNRTTKREDCGDAASEAKHDCEASKRIAGCQSWQGRHAAASGQRSALSLLLRKDAIAFVEINRRADT